MPTQNAHGLSSGKGRDITEFLIRQRGRNVLYGVGAVIDPAHG